MVSASHFVFIHFSLIGSIREPHVELQYHVGCWHSLIACCLFFIHCLLHPISFQFFRELGHLLQKLIQINHSNTYHRGTTCQALRPAPLLHGSPPGNYVPSTQRLGTGHMSHDTAVSHTRHFSQSHDTSVSHTTLQSVTRHCSQSHEYVNHRTQHSSSYSLISYPMQLIHSFFSFLQHLK